MTTALPIAERPLEALALPPAPPVVRATAERVRQRRAPALVLLVLGALLVVVPIAGGLFSKAASGQQLIDAFAPHMTPDALERYDGDLATLRRGAAALDVVYGQQNVAHERFEGIDAYRADKTAIDQRSTTLLTRIRAAGPDYRQVAGIGGFDRLPFLVVIAGLGMVYAGGVLLGGGRQRTGGAVLLALAASVALVGYPLVSGLPAGARAGDRLQHALAPVMTPATVRAEQDDFVVLVHAVGEIDTSFRAVPKSGKAARDLAALDRSWPQISSDLADLVGTINDNIANDRALADLNGLTSAVGVSGLAAMPWLLAGAGLLGGLVALAGLPRRGRKQS